MVDSQPAQAELQSLAAPGRRQMSLPSETPPGVTAYRFGPFELDVDALELRRHGLKVRLRGRPIEILQALLENRGAAVGRDDLRARLWSSDTYVDFDHGLNSAMNKLREALGDSAENPRYIETLPKRGYRFVAPVEVVALAPASAVPAEAAGVPDATTPQAAQPLPPPPPLRPRWWFWLTASLVAATVVIAGWFVVSRWQAPFAGRTMLVVLPFENRSGDAADEFFSDGITDEMIAQLGALDPARLGIIARTTSMQYKHSRKGVMEIGRELGVDYLLEGSVRRDERRVRITAQLVDVQSQTQLWAETYERDVRDVLMLQRDVAVRIAQSLAGGVLSPVLARATRRSPSFAAYERVLRGRALRQVATDAAIRDAVTIFEEAIAFDGEYAAAYAGLADCYRVLGGPGWEVAPPAELLERARAAADKALELDPELPEGYAARGMVRFSLEWDLPAAERDLARAIALNPSYARAHQYRSAVLTAMSRFDEAIESARRSHALDPLSVTDGTTLGIRLYYAGRYQDAVSQLQATLADHPGFSIAHWGLGQAYAQLGQLDDAVMSLRTAAEHAGDSPYMRAWLASTLARAGQRVEAEQIRTAIKATAEERYVPPFVFALMAAGFGEKDAALEWLERVHDARSGWVPFLPVEPEFAGLRDDPRFRALQRDVKRE
jgi:TolB-like protein/DNA-binding winged helix-turn-helix (wHTH) protein/tetratricopeptide (TPR) repeat protein